MIKRLIFYAAAFAVSLVFSVSVNAYAAENEFNYNDGYFDKNNNYSLVSSNSYSQAVSNIIKIFDNNLNSSIKSDSSNGKENTYFKISLNESIKISAFYSSMYHGALSFYDDDDNLIHTQRGNPLSNKNGKYYSFPSATKVKYIKFYNASNSGYWSYFYEFELFQDVVVYETIKSITSEVTDTSAKIYWVIPDIIKNNLDHIKINDIDIAQTTSYTLDNLSQDTEYTAKFDVVYQDGYVIKTDYKFKTLKTQPPNDVTNLKADATHTQVTLSWYTSQTNVDYLIYRKKSSLLSLFADDDYDKIGTTDAKSFVDKTVTADTDYTYKVVTRHKKTTLESKGVTVDVKTSKKPATPPIDPKPPKPPSGADDDWLIEWTQPKIGKIKVVVGGKEYKIVAASDLKVVIKNSDMVFDIWGNPDVQLIHISDDGTTQPPVPPPSSSGIGVVDLGDTITAKNLLKAALGLFALVASIVLLRMSFIVVTKLIKLIKNSYSYRGGAK